jgi:Fe-S oxidoreductase/nitrate reductase gamma subunit
MNNPPPDSDVPQLTREIFGNISHGSQYAFYVLAAVACGVFAYGVRRRMRVWQRGQKTGQPFSWQQLTSRLLRDVIGQQRIWGRGAASLAHALLFFGFLTLFVGTTLIAIEHLASLLAGRPPNQPVFHKGWYFAVYELTMDAGGTALIVGCAMFAWRRTRPGGSFARSAADWLILGLLAAIGVSGYFLEGLRILHTQTGLPAVSPLGAVVAEIAQWAGTTPAEAGWLHLVVWWGHAILALSLVALVPYTRLFHSVAGGIHLVLRDERPGTMQRVDLADVEATGKIGVGTLADFSRDQLIELDACVSCGRCEDSCPAFEAGKPLSPRNVVQDLVAGTKSPHTMSSAKLPGDVISTDTLWSCTTCGACADVCPLGISPVRMITDMRRFVIGEGGLRGSPASALQKVGRVANPWGLPPGDRLHWAEGLDLPLAGKSAAAGFDVLYWVGCAAAYDRRLQKIARSVVELLNRAKVSYAVLGTEERCTGEAARRMGDELLFQQLAEQNVHTFQQYGVGKIVAHCPHCVNSFRNDYPQLGGRYEVVHHSELLADLLAAGKLQIPDATGVSNAVTITYHDPCYLARMHGTVDQPREVLAATGNGPSGHVVELPRNRRNTACCGGGGGRMWFDDVPAERIGRERVQEIARSAATTLAISCPFCHIMLSDGLAAENSAIQVRDISELLVERIARSPP